MGRRPASRRRAHAPKGQGAGASPVSGDRWASRVPTAMHGIDPASHGFRGQEIVVDPLLTSPSRDTTPSWRCARSSNRWRSC
jgi:hypothetical protein